MKKILAIALALFLFVGLIACKDNNSPSSSNAPNPPANSEGENQKPDNTTASGSNSQESNKPDGAKLSGKLNIIDLEDRDSSILRGVRIYGNQAGTLEGFNGRKASLTDVRDVFELGEWVEFYPDTDAEYYLRVWVLKHRDDQEYYNNCKFSDLMPNFATYCDLHYPVDEEKPDEWCWGSFYLNQDDCEPGYYDFVFTYEGKAIAVLQTRFYKCGELASKSDAELEKLMRE